MRLEGSLDAFSLPDIFQLLSFTKKTGGLHLRRNGLHGVVFVTTGSLTGGCSDTRRQGLARRLLGSGLVGDDELAAAVDAARSEDGLGIARALQRAGAVDESALHGLATEHVLDSVFDLLRWPDGEFVFVVDESDPDDVGVSVPVEDAVAQARGRLDSWSHVSTTIPSPDAVLAPVLAPAEDPVLSRDEWALLALIDGARPVREVVDVTGRGEYAVVSALASLVDRGLLFVTGPEAVSAVPALLGRLSVLATLETADAGQFGIAPAELAAEAPEPAPAAAEPVLEPMADEANGANGAERAEQGADELTTAGLLDAGAAAALTEFVADAEPHANGTSPDRTPQPVGAASHAAQSLVERQGGIVPARPEPFLARRRPDHPEDLGSAVGAQIGAKLGAQLASTMATVGTVDGTSAVVAQPDAEVAAAFIERDPSVNKSLLLRLIAGVRGL